MNVLRVQVCSPIASAAISRFRISSDFEERGEETKREKRVIKQRGASKCRLELVEYEAKTKFMHGIMSF